jgi:hypothetical protein
VVPHDFAEDPAGFYELRRRELLPAKYQNRVLQEISVQFFDHSIGDRLRQVDTLDFGACPVTGQRRKYIVHRIPPQGCLASGEQRIKRAVAAS